MDASSSAPQRGDRGDRQRRPSLPAAIGAAFATLLGYAVLALSPWADADTRARVADALLVPLALLMAWSCAVAARHEARREGRRTRRAWRWLAVTGAVWALAEAVYWVQAYVLDRGQQATVADVLYVAGTLTAILALVSFPPRRRPGSERLRMLIAGLLIGLCVLFVGRVATWDVLQREWSTLTGDGLVLLIYPLADVVLATLAIVAVLLSRPANRPAMAWVAAGSIACAIGDAWYFTESLGDAPSPPTWLDLAWVVGYLCFALAAMVSWTRPTRPEEPSADQGVHRYANPVFDTLLVFVPLFLVAMVGLLSDAAALRDATLAVVSVTILLLFGAYQLLLTIDNASLERRLGQRLTELEARRVEAQQSAAWTELIVHSVVDGVVVLDERGRVRAVNPAGVRMLGLPESALVGRSADAVLHGHRDSVDGCLLARTIASSASVDSVDDSFVNAVGEAFPVEVSIGPMVHGGATAGFVLGFQDTTQRREVERMKNEFVSVVSHELRTPLTSIRGTLGLMAGGAAGPLPSAADRMVTIALESTERLTRLINDMLDIERIEAGVTSLDLATVPAADLVRQSVEGLRGYAEEHGVALDVGEVDGLVLADRDRIVQALTNLVGNAVKFSPTGGTVVVSACPAAAGDEVTFAVADQGRGIPPDMLERIFERFEQVDSSDSRQKGGTGLGLSISRSIVGRHGGRIWAESEPGAGSTFRFTLPTAPDPAPHPS